MKEEQLISDLNLKAEIFNLVKQKPLNKNYLTVSSEEREKNRKSYREMPCYGVLIYDENKGCVIDGKIVRTFATLKNIFNSLNKNQKILFHPQPVKISKEFWKEYRKAKNKLKVIEKFGILKDQNIFRIELLVIDIDQDYITVKPVIERFLQEMGLGNEDVNLFITKSNNVRLMIPIYPISAITINHNKKTNLENVKEFLKIVTNYFKIFDVKIDESFKRVNHPIWLNYPEIILHLSKRRIKFYYLYRKAKELQREYHLWEGRRVKTKVTYNQNTLNTLKKSVKTLAEKHSRNDSGRYIHFLLPVAGWCKDLGLSFDTFKELVSPYLNNSKKIEKDINTAWEKAKPLKFGTINVDKIVAKIINYLEEKRIIYRQEIKKFFCKNSECLTDEVIKVLVEKGLVEKKYDRSGRGRPRLCLVLNEERPGKIAKVSLEDERCQKNKSKTSVKTFILRKDFTPILFPQEGAMGGGWIDDHDNLDHFVRSGEITQEDILWFTLEILHNGGYVPRELTVSQRNLCLLKDVKKLFLKVRADIGKHHLPPQHPLSFSSFSMEVDLDDENIIFDEDIPF